MRAIDSASTERKSYRSPRQSGQALTAVLTCLGTIRPSMTEVKARAFDSVRSFALAALAALVSPRASPSRPREFSKTRTRKFQQTRERMSV